MAVDEQVRATYLNPELSADARARALVSQMTPAEKIAQMMDIAPAIDRLGVPAYQWWNEALHGVARAGVATVFPQAIALGATFDEPLMLQIATAISDEGRAKHHEFARKGERGRYQGLTFFSPNINIFRDPRWGRGHETFGEDPYLTGRLGVAFIVGLQGDDPKYLKTAATAKHFAVHSGPEKDRHHFDARVSRRDLFETYLPQFEVAVKEGKVESVMSAYNRVDGLAAAASPWLLQETLRERWGFEGYIVTDCWAVRDIWKDHKVAKDAADASTLAVKAGTDLECGDQFPALAQALERGQIAEVDLDRALERLFSVRFRLGLFDPPEMVAYARIPYSVNDSAEHNQLSLVAARESIVLLENRGVLPFGEHIKKIAVIGPTANNQDVLLGNYNGVPSAPVTLLEGLEAAAKSRGIEVRAAAGSEVIGGTEGQKQAALALASWADTVVMVLGITPRQEGEEGPNEANKEGDRTSLRLPKLQQELYDAVVKVKPPVVVLTGGSSLAIPEIKKTAGAIVMSWYSGQQGGTALAEVIFGDTNPAGRLPVTFYASEADLPPFDDYAMANRTYRYFEGEPLWRFGHGLSYTNFKYSSFELNSISAKPGEELSVSIVVENQGKRQGQEVVQVYVARPGVATAPIRSLRAFRRISLKAGESKVVKFQLPAKAFSLVDEEGKRWVSPGTAVISIGGGQPTANEAASSGQSATLELKGEAVLLSN